MTDKKHFRLRVRSCKSEAFEDRFRFIVRQAGNTQCAHLTASPETLKSHGHLPSFTLGKNENVFLSFLVPNAGPENMHAIKFAALWGSLVSKFTFRIGGQRITGLKCGRRLRRPAARSAYFHQLVDEDVGFGLRRRRFLPRMGADSKGELPSGAGISCG